jgi:subtilisin family serine protease
MAKFAISHRVSGKLEDADRRASKEAAEKVLKHVPTFARFAAGEEAPREPVLGGAIIEADPREIDAKRREWPADVMVEPLLKRYPTVVRLNAVRLPGPETAVTGLGSRLGLTIQSNGQAIPAAKVVAMFASTTGAGSTVQAAVTDAAGAVQFIYDPRLWSPSAAVVAPQYGFWSWWQVGPRDRMQIDLPALPATGPLGWWHQVMGILVDSDRRGEGIRIGVVDTGVGPHPYLSHVRPLGAFIDGDFDASPAAAADVENHGTHVTGIIGARPESSSGEYCGLAPDAEIFVARVFPGASQPPSHEFTANQLDIANAITVLSTQSLVDIINLSLGDATPSEIERDAINGAFENGTLAICSSGNNSPSILYPAAYPNAVAVSALGLVGTVPPSSLAATVQPTSSNQYAGNGLFVASNSAVGPKIACIAPGVGIISTVPSGAGAKAPYADMTGTSMASPAVCACLAAVLARDETYRRLPRTRARAERAALMLAAILHRLGLNPIYEGGGLPICDLPP